jgi:hypothetical protein
MRGWQWIWMYRIECFSQTLDAIGCDLARNSSLVFKRGNLVGLDETV